MTCVLGMAATHLRRAAQCDAAVLLDDRQVRGAEAAQLPQPLRHLQQAGKPEPSPPAPGLGELGWGMHAAASSGTGFVITAQAQPHSTGPASTCQVHQQLVHTYLCATHSGL